MSSGHKSSGYKPVQVPEYVYNLLQKVVDERRALNLSDAINHAVSMYLGVPYKPMSQIRAEEDFTRQMEQINDAAKLSSYIRKNNVPEDF